MKTKGQNSVGTYGNKLWPPKIVAEITSLSVETLAQWRSQGKGIPYVKLARNCVRYREKDVEEFIEKHMIPVEDLSPVRRRN